MEANEESAQTPDLCRWSAKPYAELGKELCNQVPQTAPLAAEYLFCDIRKYVPAITVDVEQGDDVMILLALTVPTAINRMRDDVRNLGFLDGAELGSLAHLVMLDEIVSLIERIMRGVTVDAESIMLDLIEKAGPGGHFLRERRSAVLCRQEVWVPTLMDREHHSTWLLHGAMSHEQRAQDKLEYIVSTLQPESLEPGVLHQIDAILARVEAELR